MSGILELLIGVPLSGALILAVFGGRWSDRTCALVGSSFGLGALVVSVLGAAAFDFDRAGVLQHSTDAAWIAPLDVRWQLGLDGISLPLVLLTTLLTLCCLGSLVRHAPHCGGVRGLAALILLMEAGVLGTFLALDLVLFFVFFETVLIPMWFVIANWGDPDDPVGRRRAATTFLLMTVTGSALMLLGFLLVQAYAGTFDLVELAGRGGVGIPAGAQLLAALAIGLGLAVKTPMWPLHIWLPDAHAKAPTVGSVLLAGVLLKMGTYGFVRIVLPVLPDAARTIAPFLAGFGVIGIVYAALACLGQSDIKRLIAYSSVGHMGFVLLGIATLSPTGVNGALFANVAHGLITGLLFFIAGGLKERFGSTEQGVLGRGLYGRLPQLTGLLAFASVASLGLPGLAGFWGEMLAMLGAFDPAGALSRATFVTFMVIAGLGAVLTAAYFLVMLRRICQGTADLDAPVARDLSAAEVLTWSPLTALTLTLGLAPGLLLAVTDPAVQPLLRGFG